jgi:predicted dehydrogenase
VDNTILNIVLVGCGAHSESAHAASLAHYARLHPGEIRLAAACDPNQERALRFCREYGFEAAFADAAEALERVPADGVIAVLPPAQTVEVGTLLLRRGKPCVLEKPPGASLEDARALARTAAETGTPHLVSMNRRFSPHLARAREWAERQGPLRCVHARMLRHARREPDFAWGTGIHVVDAVCHLGGPIQALDVTRPPGPAGSTPWFLISLSFKSGLAARIELLPTAGLVDETFELAGEDYRVFVRTMGQPAESVQCWRDGRLELEEHADPAWPLLLRNGSFEETAAFLAGLRGDAPLRPTLADVLPALAVCEAASGAPP